MEESATRIRVHLPALFRDHLASRGQVFGTVVQRTKRYIVVDLKDAEIDELMELAYGYGSSDSLRELRKNRRRGLMTSSAATWRRLRELDREKHRISTKAISVSLPAGAWEHAQHFVSIEPELAEEWEVGDRRGYRVALLPEDAEQLQRHFLLGFASTWKARKALRYAYRVAAGRLLDALGGSPLHAHAGGHESTSLESH